MHIMCGKSKLQPNSESYAWIEEEHRGEKIRKSEENKEKGTKMIEKENLSQICALF